MAPCGGWPCAAGGGLPLDSAPPCALAISEGVAAWPALCFFGLLQPLSHDAATPMTTMSTRVRFIRDRPLIRGCLKGD
jgi:hypothetical protein